MIVTKLYEAHNDDRMGYLEMFLEGRDKFRYMFVRSEPEASAHSDEGVEIDPSTNRLSCTLVIPEVLHCIAGQEIVISQDCINKSLLTRKNSSNLADIKPDNLFRKTKVVETNCKKALAFCL